MAIALSNILGLKPWVGWHTMLSITIIRCFLDKIGYKLKFIRRVRVSDAVRANSVWKKSTNQNRVRNQVVN